MDPDVPLLIPEVNAAHLDAIAVQQKNRGYDGGFIVTNPNCSTAGLVLVLKPLADAFGLEKIFVVTMQAVSGAGYPGVASLDILGNVVPFISGEEEKMEEEPQKLLGKWDGSRFIDAGMGISAHCNRVPVRDGHMECVSLSLKKIASIHEVAEVLLGHTVTALSIVFLADAQIVVGVHAQKLRLQWRRVGCGVGFRFRAEDRAGDVGVAGLCQRIVGGRGFAAREPARPD